MQPIAIHTPKIHLTLWFHAQVPVLLRTKPPPTCRISDLALRGSRILIQNLPSNVQTLYESLTDLTACSRSISPDVRSSHRPAEPRNPSNRGPSRRACPVGRAAPAPIKTTPTTPRRPLSFVPPTKSPAAGGAETRRGQPIQPRIRMPPRPLRAAS